MARESFRAGGCSTDRVQRERLERLLERICALLLESLPSECDGVGGI